MNKLWIKGNAGQGVKFLGTMLAKILQSEGYEVALSFRYSSFMRSGESNSFLVFSKEKVGNPLVEDSEIVYDLDDVSFQEELLKKYDNKKLLNMVLLGMILKKLGIKVSEEKIKEIFGVKYSEANFEGIQRGFE